MKNHSFPVVCILILSSCLSLAAATYYVAIPANGGSDSNSGTQASPFATIQHAINQTVPGDRILVTAGTYAGARFNSRSGSPGLPITLQAQAGVIVNSSASGEQDNLVIRDSSYIIIDGFQVTGSPRAGISILCPEDNECSGNILRNNYCHDNTRWGIFTGYARGVLIENNETSFSGTEHGIYVSNSADGPIIRNNISHHNNASGIQINADPALPGDGIISGAVIDSNVIYENGAAGGAAINLASVITSLIINNLLYDNHAGGIAGWDDGFCNDPNNCGFGTHDNQFLNNTIVQAANGRFAISLLHTSDNNVIKNNILLLRPSNFRGSINVDSSSEAGLDSDYNLVSNVFSFNDGDTFVDFAAWQARGHDPNSILAGSLSTIFVDPNNDFHSLNQTAQPVDHGTPLEAVADDLDGISRPQDCVSQTYDIGAYEFVLPCTDNASPTIDITSPTDSSTINGTVLLSATATDDCAVNFVEFFVDGVSLGTENCSPFSINWNTFASGNGPHTLTAVAYDRVGNSGSDSISVTVDNVFLFFDDFEDNVVSDWSFSKGAWNGAEGDLVGTVDRKGDAISPFTWSGCGSPCTIETYIRIDTAGGRASLLGWYSDKRNLVEVRLMDDKDKVLLVQKSNGLKVAKGSVPLQIVPGTFYHVVVSFNGSVFQVTIDGSVSFPVSAGVSPEGYVGFRVKSITGLPTTARSEEIRVY